MTDLLKVRVNGRDVVEIDISTMLGEIISVAIRLTADACADADGYQDFRDSEWSLDVEALAESILRTWKESRSSD